MQPYPGNPYQQPAYSQGHPRQSAGGAVPAGLTESIASAGKLALAFIGFRLAIPLVFRFVPIGRMLPLESAAAIMSGIKGLAGLLALIFYFVWFARMYSWVRAARGGTRFSNGMAIGGWFIPFANFAIPYMALRDAWRRAANDENGYLVAIWWLSYIVAMVLEMFWSSQGARLLGGNGMSIETMNSILSGLSWLTLLAQLGAWGLLGYFVQTLTQRATSR